MTSPPLDRPTQEELEVRQLELRVMAQELAVLAQQIQTTERATRAFQQAQRRDWELRRDKKRARIPWWAPPIAYAAVGLGIAYALRPKEPR